MANARRTLSPKGEGLIVILGPTASGKTDIALRLAKKFGGEIISADSRAIYKEMDIGTAKPIHGTWNVEYGTRVYKVEGIPHYMIDVVRPDQEFTVAQFKRRTIKIIKDVQKRKKIPFLVGGTGLYISAIVDNLKIPQVLPDQKLRKKLEKLIEKRGLNFLWQRLIRLDPTAQKFVDKDNPRRVIRALEVCLKTKKTFSELRKTGKPLFDVIQIGVKFPRCTLYKRINARVDKMVEIGLIDEVKNIYKQLYKKLQPQKLRKEQRLGKFRDSNIFCDSVVARKIWHLPSMSGIGYRQIGLYLQGEISLPEAVDLIKKNTRHYAKRQITWFKRDKRIKWIKNYRVAQNLIKKFLI